MAVIVDDQLVIEFLIGDHKSRRTKRPQSNDGANFAVGLNVDLGKLKERGRRCRRLAEQRLGDVLGGAAFHRGCACQNAERLECRTAIHASAKYSSP